MKRLASPGTPSAFLMAVGLFTGFSCLPGSLASADTIALYDFEQYSNGSTGETNPDDSSSDPRVYQPSTALAPVTGITSVSNVSFTVSDTTTTDQN